MVVGLYIVVILGRVLSWFFRCSRLSRWFWLSSCFGWFDFSRMIIGLLLNDWVSVFSCVSEWFVDGRKDLILVWICMCESLSVVVSVRSIVMMVSLM